MISFLRRTFRRGRRRPPQNSTQPNILINHISAPPKTKKSKCFTGYVILLDEEKVSVDIPKKALGSWLIDRVTDFVDINKAEGAYFGLQYTDKKSFRFWLDPDKQIRKQLSVGPPFTLHFRVKFYPSEPNLIKDESTRYQMFLQLKQDLKSRRRLGNATFNTATEMAALSLQSELGDYNDIQVNPYVISQFRFVPDQSEDFEMAVLDYYKNKCLGKLPCTAELEFLNKAKWLDMYGVDIHDVISNVDGNQYQFGLTPRGVVLFDKGNRIGLFVWQRTKRLDFKGKKILLDIGVEDKKSETGETVHKFIFQTPSSKATKHLWKCAIEHHQFYRLKQRTENQNKDNFFRTSSRFGYHGRTELEIQHTAFQRRGTSFIRKPSKRYKAREVFATFSNFNHKPREFNENNVKQSFNQKVPQYNPNFIRQNTKPKRTVSSNLNTFNTNKSTLPARTVSDRTDFRNFKDVNKSSEKTEDFEIPNINSASKTSINSKILSGSPNSNCSNYGYHSKSNSKIKGYVDEGIDVRVRNSSRDSIEVVKSGNGFGRDTTKSPNIRQPNRSSMRQAVPFTTAI